MSPDLPRALRYFTDLQSAIGRSSRDHRRRLISSRRVAPGRGRQAGSPASWRTASCSSARASTFPHVKGERLPPSASAARPQLGGRPFEVIGVSLVLHPRNPYAPTVHMNLRFFAARSAAGDAQPAWWFGGGMDLTPCYGFEEDAIHFHRTCRDALVPFGGGLPPAFQGPRATIISSFGIALSRAASAVSFSMT